MSTSIPFDKKLAELDAYLQMLIIENDSLEHKLNNFNKASSGTINTTDSEFDGIVNIKNQLEKLIGSIKHSIVLLQIARVSSRASFSSTAGDLKSLRQQATPSPPTRSKFRPSKSTPFGTSKYTNSKLASQLSSSGRDSQQQRFSDSSTSNSSSSATSTSITTQPRKNLPQDGADYHRQKSRQVTNPPAALSSSAAEHSQRQQEQRECSASSSRPRRSPPPPPRPSQIHIDTTAIEGGSPPWAPTNIVELVLALQSDSFNGAGKGYTTTNINKDGINSDGPQTNERTPSSGSRFHTNDSVATINHDDDDDGDDDDDDDEAFFDAADVQQNQSKSISNVDSLKERADSSSSAIRATHPNSPPKLGPSEASTNRPILTSSLLTSQAQNNNGDMVETNNNIDGQTEDQGIEWDALYEEEDEDELDSLEGQGSVIKHLLSQIRIGMDLTKVVLPTFILERRSLLEMYADFFAHPDLFSAIPNFDTPEERMIQLVRWYLSAFHAGRKSSLAKKPYNPILGEIFKCEWRLDEGASHGENRTVEHAKTRGSVVKSNGGDADNNVTDSQQALIFVAEQVSHHPPVSAFYAENKEQSISCCAHIYTKSKYLGLSVGVHNIGKGVINLEKHNETYVCSFPSAYGRSILTVPWVELGGPVSITCEQTGFKANIEFVMKPFYGGKKHRVTGEILRPNNEPILTIDGEWNGIMYSKSPPSSSAKQVFVDTSNLPLIKKRVKPVTVQESFESRNVWKEVTRALKLRDVNSATAAKSYIEQRQRDLLKDRVEKGIKWRTRYFEPVENEEGWQYAGETKLDNDLVDGAAGNN